MGLVKRLFLWESFGRRDINRPGKKDALPRGRIGRFGAPGGSVKDLAKLLPQGQAGAVQPALHGRDRQIQRVGDVLVGEPVHVLEQEQGSLLPFIIMPALVDRASQLSEPE